MEIFFISVIAGLLIGFLVGRRRQLASETVGERAVRSELSTIFPSPSYHLLNSVTLPCQDGSTQIDHILVSSFGVFVIESKHYTGWIFASAKSAQWTQVIYKVKHKFQNPLRQNYKHYVAVQKLLDFIPKEHIYSAVVFTGDAEFKTEVPSCVYNLEQLVSFIKSKNTEVVSQNRVQFCVGRLECTRFALTSQTDVEHRANLENRF
jgi:restriction system protein